MKKILFLLYFIFYVPQSLAYSCINTFTGRNIPFGKGTIIEIPIDENIEHNSENIFGNVADYIQCKNDQPQDYIDYVDLKANGVQNGPALSSLETGVYIKGQRLLSNNVPKTNVFTLRDGNYHPVDIQMFFMTPNKLGQNLIIEKGQQLMTLHLSKYSVFHGVTQSSTDFDWIFVSGNKAVLTTGSCSINHDQEIYIDFGMVPKSKVSTNGLDSVAKDVELNIDCDDSSINNQKIKISLSADAASFSANAIATNFKSKLGVEMYHNNQVIAPFQGFTSILNGGISTETITFALIRPTGVTNNDLPDGQFTASASLIVSLP